MNGKLREYAQNDAETFAFAASLYNVNPEEKFIKAMKKLSPEKVEYEPARKALEKMNSFPEKDLIKLKRDWTKLFRGVSPEYGPKAPCEELYSRNDSRYFLQELGKTYVEAGYARFAEFPDRPDYIGVQLDFLASLSLLRLDAIEKGDAASYEKLTKIFENFLENRLEKWFPEFKKEAEKHVQTDFYRGVLDLTDAILKRNPAA